MFDRYQFWDFCHIFNTMFIHVHLKLNDMSTILQEYSYNYSLSCNMIGTITMVIVGSICTSLVGIILRINGIMICIMLWISYKIFNTILLYVIEAHLCHHARFDLISFINDAILNTFDELFILFVCKL